MTSSNACLACQPAALQAFIRAEPIMAAMWQALPRRSFEPRDVLQRLGDTSTRCWLIEAGLVRFYYLSEQGVERNRSFHTQGSWVGGSMPPLTLPSPCTIEALEPTQTVELAYATLQEWHRQFPQVQPLLDDAIGYLFTQQACREAELLTLSPEERYQAFVRRDADLAGRLRIHHVASHLGISHVSLSRIRARLGMVPTSAR